MQLMAIDAAGALLPILVSPFDLHHLHSCGGRTFHVVPEAAAADHSFEVCSKCKKQCTAALHHAYVREPLPPPTKGVAKPLLREDCPIFEGKDLYFGNAPAHSIAAGCDFGRLSALRRVEVATDVSVLEMLVLGHARCHMVSIQVTSYGHRSERQTLYGHTIIFPHAAERSLVD